MDCPPILRIFNVQRTLMQLLTFFILPLAKLSPCIPHQNRLTRSLATFNLLFRNSEDFLEFRSSVVTLRLVVQTNVLLYYCLNYYTPELPKSNLCINPKQYLSS